MQPHEQLARAEALVGKDVGSGLKLERVLAVGDLFSVFAATSPTRGALAVKLLHPELARVIGGDMPSVLRMANDLSHPRAPKVADEIAVGDTLGVVTERVTGESVASLLRRRRTLPPSEALRVAHELSSVIETAHSRGLCHGALTPSHVLVAENGTVHVVGFGERRLRQAAGLDVPPVWLAPELALSRADAPLADLWAVAALAFAMMTGSNPYGGAVAERSRPAGVLQPLGQIAPRANPELCAAIDRALSRDPTRRWEDAGALRAALQTVAQIPAVLLAPSFGSQLAAGSVAPPVLDAVRELRRTAPPTSTPAKPPTVPPSNPPKGPPKVGIGARALAALAAMEDANDVAPVHGLHESDERRTPPSPTFQAKRPGSRPPARPGDSARPAARAGDSARPRAAGSAPPLDEKRVGSSRPPGKPPSSAPAPPRIATPPSPGASHGVFVPPTEPALGAPRAPASAGPAPAVPTLFAADPDGPRGPSSLLLGPTADERGTVALEKLLVALERAVRARTEPDAGDPRTALEDLDSAAEDALSAGSALTCRVSEDALTTLSRPVWSAPGALAPAVRALRAAGVKLWSFLPGLSQRELGQLVELLARAHREPVLELSDADFSHVVLDVPDPLASVAAEHRPTLDRERRRLLALFALDSSFQLEDAWNAARAGPTRAPGELARATAALSSLWSSGSGTVAEDRFLSTSSDDWERLFQLSATAFEGAAFEPALETFGPLLRAHLERTAEAQPELAAELAVRVVRSVRGSKKELPERQQRLAARVISAPMVSLAYGRLIGRALGHRVLDRLGELLPLLGAEHCASLAMAAPHIPDLQLGAKVAHHLEYGVTNHEQTLADVALRADPVTALFIVRLLSRIDTLRAKDALERVARSPHIAVRLEALGARDGAASERLRHELRLALEEAPEHERVATLRTLIDSDVRVAGPAIALRVRAPDVDSLSFEERRLLFNALCLLAPNRAEPIAREILGKSKLIGSAAHHETRALAAAALGGIGSEQESLDLLEEVARPRWNANETVRETAARALEQVRERIAAHQRQSRQPMSRSSRGPAPPPSAPPGAERTSAAPARRSHAPGNERGGPKGGAR